jgi:ribosome-binding factor A
MGSIRQSKVESLLKRDLGSIFQMHSRELGIKEMISVTTIRISPDLSYAKVYISIFPSTNAEGALNEVIKNASSIRGWLGKKIGKQVRVVPELAFQIDDSLDYADHIDDLLKS